MTAPSMTTPALVNFHSATNSLRASALFVLDLAASPRRRRQAGVGARLSAVGEGAAKPFGPERGGEFRPDAIQAQKQGDGRRLRLGGRSCVPASAFDEPVEQPVAGAL